MTSFANISSPGHDPDALSVLVIDDDPQFVETLGSGFRARGVRATEMTSPASLLRSTKDYHLADYDMIFLDMHLGLAGDGTALSAADLLLQFMTYSPSARVVTFTGDDITVRECARCIQLGSLGVIPKTYDIDHLILVAKVYRDVGDSKKAREERIRSLWARMSDERSVDTGKHLEMLMVNLFDSVDGMRVILHNFNTLSGEIDLVVENACESGFWGSLDSFHLLIECKKQDEPAEKSDFNVFQSKIRRKSMCKSGILVSWSGVSSGFRLLQSDNESKDAPKIFCLDRHQLLELVKRRSEDREAYLRGVLSSQA